MVANVSVSDHRTPRNKGKIVGQKAPFRQKDIWALRVRLQLDHRTRELALFDLGIDSKLRGCDLLKLKVSDICHGNQVSARATVMQQKTQRPVQFEITASTRDAVGAWIAEANLTSEDCLFPSRVHKSGHLGTRQYARILDGWGEVLGARPLFLRNALHASHEGNAHLQRDEESPCGATVTGTHQAGEYSPLSRDRSRRRHRNRRAD